MSAAAAAAPAPFGVYLHVPFCAARCGYCDFNTYTPGELGEATSPASYLDAILGELDFAAADLARRGIPARPAETVFVGGGTPSLLGAAGLARLLEGVRGAFGLAPGAEVTTEANPESTDPAFFAGIRAAGFTRVSLGMQSAAPHVLATLGRRHRPGRPVAAAAEARAAGFDHVNLDLIYGTPGESMADLDASLDAVLAAGVDHVSAYSLIVEEGTAMARRVRRGELPMPDDDDLAERHARIDARLVDAGLSWYEVSNWAAPGGRCRHNLLYWRDGDWWGAGPGAHSHLGGRRFHNVKHPARYAALVSAGRLPLAGEELLTEEDRHVEALMLGLRLAEGIPAARLRPAERARAEAIAGRGLLEFTGAGADRRLRVTDAGRLLADGLVLDLLG